MDKFKVLGSVSSRLRSGRSATTASSQDSEDEDEVDESELLEKGANVFGSSSHKKYLSPDSFLGSNSNPLLVGIVLDNVFEHLCSDLDMLKVCRSVCTTWHEAATKHFRKLSICIPMRYSPPLQFKTHSLYGQLYSSQYSAASKKSITVPDSIYKGFFHQALPRIVPYENIYMTENIKGSMENRVSMNDSVVTKWFQDWGLHIKGIRLKLKTFSDKDKTSSFLQSILTRKCVNLEELEILGIWNLSFQELHLEKGQLPKIKKLLLRDNRNSLSESSKAGVLSQVATIFAATPNVESIVLDIEDHTWTPKFAKLIAESFKMLKTLQWNSDLHEKHVRELAKMSPKVQLKSIDLNCRIVRLPANILSLKRFLGKFANSLETLRFTGDVTDNWTADPDSESDSDSDLFNGHPPIGFEFFELDFPQLEKLKVLEMGNIAHGHLNNFIALVKFPNLEKLILKKTSSKDGHIIPPTLGRDNFLYFQNYLMGLVTPHTKLLEFHLEADVRIRDFMSTLSLAFPNLKVLHLRVHSERIFAEVFRTMKSLEELNLKFTTTEFPLCNSTMTRSLVNMPNLKRLTLEHLGANKFQLTKNTVAKGFKRAKNLRWLHLIKFAVCQSERESILNHLKHYVTLKFTNCVIQSPPLNAVYGILSSVDPFSNIQELKDADESNSCDSETE